MHALVAVASKHGNTREIGAALRSDVVPAGPTARPVVPTPEAEDAP